MFGISKFFKALKWKKKLQYFFLSTVVLGTLHYFWPQEVAQGEVAYWYLKIIGYIAIFVVVGLIIFWLLKKFFIK